MTYPFIAASAKYGARKGPVMAFVIHMAEGSGTVGFLSRPNPRGVSVHYVVESTGRIVQMVKETDATGSINPNDLRTTNDPLVYGATVRKAVMGAWDHDPNSAVISVEVEGFAKSGPNTAQHGSLKTLVADVRSRYPDMGLLGHRDFQDYKECPGKLVHWGELGGHGPAEAEMAEQVVEFTAPAPFTANDPVNGAASWAADAPHAPLSRVKGALQVDGTVYITDGTPHGQFVRVVTGTTGRRIVPARDVKPTTATGDCTQAIADAKASEHERVRTLALQAVGAI